MTEYKDVIDNTDKNNMKNKIFKSIKISLLAILAILIGVIVTFYSLGYRALIVNGWSMGHLISYQSVIVIDSPEPSDVELGDAITYTRNDGQSYTTHMLVEIKNEQNDVIAEFRDYSNYQSSWEDGEAYVETYEYLGEDVAAWYSGEEINKNSIFTTKSVPLLSHDPSYTHIIDYDQGEADSPFGYDNIHGRVVADFEYLGRAIFFIQRNIILVAGTLMLVFILISAIKKDLNSS